MQHDKKYYELSAEEKAKFVALSRERSPADVLEEKIVSTLKAKGLIQMKTSSPIWTFPRAAVAFGAAMVLLLLGFSLGRWQRPSPSPSANHPLFALFLYDAPETPPDDPSKVAEYGGWARAVSMSKRMITGEKLKDSGRLLRKVQGQLEIRDIKEAGISNVLGGYFLIEAESYDDAIKIAAGCPHLKYGGLIELRQIDPI